MPRLPVRGEPVILIPDRLRDFRVYKIAPDLWLANLPFRRIHVEALRDAGAKTVLNLCEDEEYLTFRTRPSQRQEIEEAYAEAGIEEIRLPMADKSAHSGAALEWAVQAFREAEKSGRTPIVVHCRGGRERSATALGAILVERERCEVKVALAQIREVYGGASPLRSQRQALERWAAQRPWRQTG